MTSSEVDDWLNLLDFDAIAEPFDKILECQYFLDLAAKEQDVQRFRWMLSAFLGAAYSFFEISALKSFHAFSDPKTGTPIKDDEALEKLRCYVTVSHRSKKTLFVKTVGHHEITKQLYEFRRRNTHHFPMSIMSEGVNLPEGFCFGHIKGQGIPALAFCRAAMSLMHQVQQELQA